MHAILTVISVHILLCLCCHGNPTGSKVFHYIDKKGDIVQVIPASVYKRYFETRSADVPGDTEHHVYKRCRCYCRRKWERDYVCCGCADSTCFPNTATVRLATGERRSVDNITAGETILTADTSGRVHPTEFLGYLQKDPDVISQYVTIWTESKTLSLSRSHLIYTATSRHGDFSTRYANEVQTGDFVIMGAGNHSTSSKVLGVDIKGMQGAFVPLTESGTLLVDDILVSCYASFPHTLSHIAMAPLRWFPSFLGYTPEGGSHPYMDFMKGFGRFVLPGELLYSTTNNSSIIEGDININTLGDMEGNKWGKTQSMEL